MIPRYTIDTNDPWEDVLQADQEGAVCKWEEVEPLLKELRSLRRYRENIDEALNSGDGVYRP